jgi:hypothetical protein
VILNLVNANYGSGPDIGAAFHPNN